MTEVTMDKRAPPSAAVLEATSISRQAVAGRVKLAPTDDGWRTVIDIPRTSADLPPADVPTTEWNAVDAPSEEELVTFHEYIDELSTAESSNVDKSGDYERRVLTYD